MLQTMKRVLVGAGLMVGLSATAQAQFLTDAGSPLGSGGGLSGAVANFMGSSAAGGSPALAAVVAGGASPQAIASLTTALGGGTAAGALAQALATLGSTPTPQSAVAAIIAFNAAVDAAPAGSPPPAMDAARQLLISLGAKPAR